MGWVGISLAGFSAALWVSARLYPGGTWFDVRSQGFSFWGNFWCDLLHSPALNDMPNPRGAFAAQLAFWLFAAALLRFWPLAARLCPSPGARRWIVALGSVGALALVLVTVFSSRDEPSLHAVCVIGSALLGVIAATILALATYARADALTRALSVSLITSAGVSLFQYARQGAGAEPAEWLAGAQKITTFALLAFMARCAWLLRTASADGGRAVAGGPP